MKICWLGLRTENPSESLSDWLEYGEEGDYNWYWVMVSLKDSRHAIVPIGYKYLLKKRMQLLEENYPNEVYQIFEEDV